MRAAARQNRAQRRSERVPDTTVSRPDIARRLGPGRDRALVAFDRDHFCHLSPQQRPRQPAGTGADFDHVTPASGLRAPRCVRSN